MQANAANRRSKLDETVELVLHLGLDPRRGDQVVRGSLMLPHGSSSSKRLRICVFAEGSDAQLAKDMGEKRSSKDLV